MKRIEYVPNQKINSLIFLREVSPAHLPSGQTRRRALFQCECGKEFEAMIDSVKRGKIVSCKCKQSTRGRENNLLHGLTDTTIYRLWQNMKTRCYNPKTWNFNNYGGRGIIICDEWKNDFMVFHDWCVSNGHQKGLQIDRVNNDGNYEPENCRFVTNTTNTHNRRTTRITFNDALDIRNLKLLIPGISLKEIAEAYQLTQTTVSNILNHKQWVTI